MPRAPIPQVSTRRPTEQEQALAARVRDLEQRSLETLEAHARQMVTLSTTLLAALLGLLSLDRRPTWLTQPVPQTLAALAVILLFLALALALAALSPRRHVLPRGDLSAQEQTLNRLLTRKARSVTRATWSFGLAMLAVLATVLFALFS